MWCREIIRVAVWTLRFSASPQSYDYRKITRFFICCCCCYCCGLSVVRPFPRTICRILFWGSAYWLLFVGFTVVGVGLKLELCINMSVYLWLQIHLSICLKWPLVWPVFKQTACGADLKIVVTFIAIVDAVANDGSMELHTLNT